MFASAGLDGELHAACIFVPLDQQPTLVILLVQLSLSMDLGHAYVCLEPSDEDPCL